RRIAALERRKIEEEYKEKLREIAYLEDLLTHPKKILKVIRAELEDLKARYADPRRTQIVSRAEQPLTARDLLPDETVAVVLGEDGEMARWPAPEDAAGWKPILAARGKVHPAACAVLNTRQDLLCITARGEAAAVPAHRVPEAGTAHVADLCGLTRRDRVVALLPLPHEAEGAYLFLATAQGQVKRVRAEEARTAAARGVTPVIQVSDGDEPVAALLTDGSQEVILVSSEGRAIRFGEDQVRPMGLPAGGVAGMRLGRGARVVAAQAVESRASLVVVTEGGYAKRSDLDEYPVQGRGGAGVLTARVSAETGPVVGAVVARASDQVWVRTVRRLWTGQARRVPKQGRATRGERLSIAARDRAVRVMRAPRTPEG
ncbi:MAG: DNA gyrase subunit A, partial [Anaerolineae bacterium]|nr:DNA gyrase subunit A [Anaerolineae bacterium]